MVVLTAETCWALNEHNKISGIKLVFSLLNWNIKRLKPVMKGEDSLCLETAHLYNQQMYIQYE